MGVSGCNRRQAVGKMGRANRNRTRPTYMVPATRLDQGHAGGTQVTEVQYAEMILRGKKTVEVRSWATRLTGERFYIYAARTPVPAEGFAALGAPPAICPPASSSAPPKSPAAHVIAANTAGT